MKRQYDSLTQMVQGSALTLQAQINLWEEFLGTFGDDLPLITEDDALRENAKENLKILNLRLAGLGILRLSGDPVGAVVTVGNLSVVLAKEKQELQLLSGPHTITSASKEYVVPSDSSEVLIDAGTVSDHILHLICIKGHWAIRYRRITRDIKKTEHPSDEYSLTGCVSTAEFDGGDTLDGWCKNLRKEGYSDGAPSTRIISSHRDPDTKRWDCDVEVSLPCSYLAEESYWAPDCPPGVAWQAP